MTTPAAVPPAAADPAGASALGVSRDVIYDQLRTGRLKSLKVGRRRIIGRHHIDGFLAGR